MRITFRTIALLLILSNYPASAELQIALETGALEGVRGKGGLAVGIGNLGTADLFLSGRISLTASPYVQVEASVLDEDRDGWTVGALFGAFLHSSGDTIFDPVIDSGFWYYRVSYTLGGGVPIRYYSKKREYALIIKPLVSAAVYNDILFQNQNSSDARHTPERARLIEIRKGQTRPLLSNYAVPASLSVSMHKYLRYFFVYARARTAWQFYIPTGDNAVGFTYRHDSAFLLGLGLRLFWERNPARPFLG